MDERLKEVCLNYEQDEWGITPDSFQTIDDRWVIVDKRHFEKLLEIANPSIDTEHKKALIKANEKRKNNKDIRDTKIVIAVLDGWGIEDICNKLAVSISTVYRVIGSVPDYKLDRLVNSKRVSREQVKLFQQSGKKYKKYIKLLRIYENDLKKRRLEMEDKLNRETSSSVSCNVNVNGGKMLY